MNKHDREILLSMLGPVERVGGNFISQTQAHVRHSRAVREALKILSTKFGDGDGGPGGWIIMAEQDITVPQPLWDDPEDEEWLRPDLSGWLVERMPVEPDVARVELRPDWVCEVLSSNWRYDREVKFPKYEAMGIPWAWIIDAKKREIEVYKLGKDLYGPTQRVSGDDRVSLQPFEAVEFDLGKLWLPR